MRWLGSFLGAREMAEGNFKRDGDGWIFQAPAPRQMFGLRPAYRVDDGQKEKLKEFFTSTYGTCMLAVVVASPLFGLGLIEPLGWRSLALSGLIGLVIGLVPWAFYFRAVKRLLPDSQAVDARIKYGESFANSASAMTMPRLLTYLGLSMVMFVGAVFAWHVGDKSGLDLFGVVFFACVTLTFVAMLVTRSRRTALSFFVCGGPGSREANATQQTRELFPPKAEWL